MSIEKTIVVAAALLLAGAANAAPARGDSVAEGFMDWEGLNSKNFLSGRTITASDLRHKAVVYVVLDGAKLTNATIPGYFDLLSLAPMPASHVTQWETQELPRDRIVAVSVRNIGKATPKEFAAVLAPPKDAATALTARFATFGSNRVPFYRDFSAVGEEGLGEDKLPYVAVYGGSGTEPLYVKEKWSAAEMKSVREALKKAVAGLEAWTPPLGVAEPQFYKKVASDMAKGKPAQSLIPQLKAGIKSKNPDQAKEAQIMFDALNQYKSDLMLRIPLEFHSAPARAYYDFNVLMKNFPAERKKMQAIDAKLKANKELSALGKAFEKILLWGKDDYVCKNASEAKKNVQELQKIKKTLELLSNSQNAQLQGEAMLFLSQVDTLIEVMPTKVVAK